MLDFLRSRAALFLCVAVCLFTACGYSGAQSKGKKRPSVSEVKKQAAKQPADNSPRAAYGAPVKLAVLEVKGLNESSGVAASRVEAGVFWTHNDSGDGPFVYAFDRTGKSRGTFRVIDAKAYDWEDIAIGPGPAAARSYLYVGDIGDNAMARSEIIVYRFPEPAPLGADASKSKRDATTTEPAEAIRLKYPDGAHDAEALMVHPSTGDLYVVTKTIEAAAGVYKLRAPFSTSTVNTLERVGQVSATGPFGGFFTGGDISPDGRRVVLCDYVGGYELSLPDNSQSAFDDVWKVAPLAINLGERIIGEAVCYGVDGKAIYATSERPPVPLIEVKRSP